MFKLGDFGISAALNTDYTQTATGYMTNEYASYEQFIDGARTLLSDEWAVGVLFHKLIAHGKHPFDV